MEIKLNIVAIVQARMGSTRLPGKVMMPIGGYTLIELLLMRLNESVEIDDIVVATSKYANNKVLIDHVRSLGFTCVEGSENDVLKRYYDTAVKCSADVVIRITADCPLIDSTIVDECVKEFKRSGVDYLSNNHPESYPDGLDVEVFSFLALKQAHLEASSNFEREHVTPYIRNCNKFIIGEMVCHEDHSDKRWTVDELKDFNVIKNIFDTFLPKINFSWLDVLELFNNRPELFDDNKGIVRNQGAKMGTGQKLYLRAKNIIPGGNMLLSKRPEMFLPSLWPSYFDSAKGCNVTDLDGNEFTDMCIMGIGTNSLGYGNDFVDNAVSLTVGKGNMSTLNCPEEVMLLEKLISIHSWAGMGKLTRSGGEANAVALRIGRAFTGKSKVAICGYHGWHDWYLSANLSQSNGLDQHLLPGLSTKGVPKVLKGEVLTFFYNDISSLESLLQEHNDLGVIFMEVQRNHAPIDNFLQKVRQLADSYGAVLIFDECTSGFRETFGGLHLKYGVEPDLAMFGKALGNGYAINAVIGTDEVMQEAQDSFISSTFWTERIGPTAALATLKKMEELQSWRIISSYGKKVKGVWTALAEEFDLKIEIQGLDSLASFTFLSHHSLIYKTFLTQEMLKKGYLASTIFYASTAHSSEIIDAYGKALRPIFECISEVERGLKGSSELLDADVCHQGFKRLN